jgi:uncharacterized membrane protein
MNINYKTLIYSIIILTIFDAIYLKTFSAHWKQQVLDVQNSPMQFKWIPTIICYIVIIASINYFILQTDKSSKQKIIDATVLGLVIYTIFETTNMAIFKNWNIKSVIIDSIWGGILYGLTTFIIVNIT